TRLVYNDEAGWVWESTDYAFSTVTGPTSLPTLNAPTLGAIGGGTGSATARLKTPTISPEDGTLALAAYPLQVSIAKDPGDPQSAKIFYSTQPGSWLEYAGPFVIDPGTNVSAYTSHDDPAFNDSELATSTFNNDPAGLEIAINVPKNPITYAEAGGPLEEGNYTPEPPLAPITVALTSSDAIPAEYENNNYFNVHWTYDGSDPRSSGDRHSGGNFNGEYAGDAVDYTLPRWDGASLLPIQIVAQSNNPAFVEDSAVLSANISIEKTILPLPVISYNDTDTSRGDTVEISKALDGGDMPIGARIYYTTDGTDPGDDDNGGPVSGTLYTGPFDPLLDNELATDATIVARVYPPEAHAAWFNVSEEVNTNYSVPLWEISGNTSGWFTDAQGGSGMVASFGGNDQIIENYNHWNSRRRRWETGTQTVGGSYFQWGDPGNWGTGANWLNFNGSAFEDVASNERFHIGQLSYYNGTISMSSLATAVDFTVKLDFGGTPAEFDYAFDLLTTPNNGTAWQNADYVWFNDTVSAQNVSLYGIDYSLNVEFGETSQYGFSSIDQFHVQEAQSASANLYATLVEVGSWW
ncbi:MAG: hypothetical protein GY720_14940, partial [bacterium]|nr:hypothetical protein [bacterium]